LIADECHHYGAEKWSRALDDNCGHRLGLTATYEREDDGCDTYLTPYFRNLCYQLNYEEGLADGVIANFKIAFVGATFSSEEASAYKEYDDKAYRYKKILVNQYNLPSEPFGLFMQAVGRLRNAEKGRASKIAGFYLSAFTRRRHIMAEAAAKLRRIWELRSAVRFADRTIAFAQTRVAAQKVIGILSKANISGEVLDSTMDMNERQRVFAGFEKGEHELMAAPRLLDEGVDVPSADLGIVLATSRSRRQLIQRMGRVLRIKPDGRLARIVILYIGGTAEDPDCGAHEDFMDIVTEAASDIKVFRANRHAEEICSYLNDI
jgi:RNA polymerase primary sigma factor